MPRGGARPGAGRPRKLVPVDTPAPRPRFDTALDFARWALNAPDAEVPMDAKLRVAVALLREKPMPGKRAMAAEAAQDAEKGTTWERLLQN